MIRYSDVHKGVRVQKPAHILLMGTLTGEMEPEEASTLSRIEVDWDDVGTSFEYATDLYIAGDAPNNSRLAASMSDFLLITALKATTATGYSPSDAKYDRAEEVKRGTWDGYVNVRYQGVWYRNVYRSWGPLDGDHAKSTVKIQSEVDKLWYILWYYNIDVQ